MYSRVGSIAGAAGSINPLTSEPTGGLIVAPSGGKYREAANAGRLFMVGNQAAIAVTAAFAATFTGLAVGNPVGSGVNVSIINVGFGNTVVGVSVGTVGIMGGASNLLPITASLVPANCKLGGPASKCTATAGQTINAAPAPTLLTVLAEVGTGAVTTWQLHPCNFDIDGRIVIPPGYYFASYCFMLANASLQFSFAWEEIPIV